MELYFGRTNDTNDTFSQDNKNYYYLLESSNLEDGVVLNDSCNRSVPFATEDIPALITALNVYMEEEGTLNILIERLQEAREDNIIITID